MAGGAALSVGSITFAVSSNKILELIGARVSPRLELAVVGSWSFEIAPE